MTAPICVPCARQMACSKTGRTLAECRTSGEVFRLRSVDEYVCPDCGAVVCLIDALPYAERGMVSADGHTIDERLASEERLGNVVRVTYPG